MVMVRDMYVDHNQIRASFRSESILTLEYSAQSYGTVFAAVVKKFTGSLLTSVKWMPLHHKSSGTERFIGSHRAPTGHYQRQSPFPKIFRLRLRAPRRGCFCCICQIYFQQTTCSAVCMLRDLRALGSCNSRCIGITPAASTIGCGAQWLF